MMVRHNLSVVCLVFFFSVSFSLAAQSAPACVVISQGTNGSVPGAGYFQTKEGPGPRKKTRKGRRTILDKKSKMKSGKRCPSF